LYSVIKVATMKWEINKNLYIYKKVYAHTYTHRELQQILKSKKTNDLVELFRSKNFSH